MFEEPKPKRIKTNSDLLDQEEVTGLSDLFNEELHKDKEKKKEKEESPSTASTSINKESPSIDTAKSNNVSKGSKILSNLNPTEMDFINRLDPLCRRHIEENL